MQKSEYREYFANAMVYVKLRNVLNQIGMGTEQGNLSRFIKSEHYDYLYSIERLDYIYSNMVNILHSLT